MPTGGSIGREHSRLLASVSAALAKLLADCSKFSRLEKNIVSFSQKGEEIVRDIEHLGEFYQSSTNLAIKELAADINDALDAFQTYVMERDGRDDADHVIGLTRVGKHLRTALQKASSGIDKLARRGVQRLDTRAVVAVTLPVTDEESA